MKRLRVQAVVKESKESAFKKGVYYIVADAKGWGEVRYVTNKRRAVGDKVVLQDQWNRIQSDRIRWEETK